MDSPYEVAVRLESDDPGDSVWVDDHFTGWRSIGEVELAHFVNMASDPGGVVVSLAETGAAVLNATLGPTGRAHFVSLAVRRCTDAA